MMMTMRSVILSWIITSLLGTLVWSADLSEIASILPLPLKWTTQTIRYKTSGNCVANVAQSSWILGGKAVGVLNDISNTARKEQFTSNGFTTLMADQTMLLPGSFPGQYVASPGMFCTLSAQTAYGLVNNSPKLCYLGANDGTSNSPQCACCNVDSNGRCDDLDALKICPPVFRSCVVNDVTKNRAIQIGGNTGTNAVNNILCFNIATQRYTSNVDTVSRLQTESTTVDQQCEYRNLATAAYDVGCDMMANDVTRSIVVVGGRGATSFLDIIQLCKPSYQDCTILNLKLPKALSQVRVLGLTKCIFAAFGGLTASGTTSSDVLIGDICDQKWLSTQSMPKALAEFGLIIGTNTLCLYGGISNNQLQDTAYCTSYKSPPVPTTLKPTRKPTKPPTLRPTRPPVASPTPQPTIPGQGVPQFFNGWQSFYKWNDGRDSQSCYATGDNLFVFGGKNGAQQTLNTMSMFDSRANKWDFQMYQYNPLIPSQAMSSFYCPNACSAGYKDRIYLVNPRMGDGSTAARLFECTLDYNGKSTMCRDLCDINFGILPYCTNLLLLDTCVTSQNQYIYIVGGRDSISRRNSITVFDMHKRDWASVPEGTPAASRYPTLYGRLATSVTNHGCAAWNFNVFVFGGQSSSGNTATNSIQKCTKDAADCTLQKAKLDVSRYYASAVAIGSTIVIVGGARDSQSTTDVVELYDVVADKITVNYNGQANGLIIPSARRSSCVARWDSASMLVLAGGITAQGSLTNDKTIYTAPYGIQEQSSSGKALADCYNIVLQTSNNNFKGSFTYYTNVNQYRVWTSSKYDAVIYYQPENQDYTWVGNLSTQDWAYYPSPGFTSNYWKILSTQKTLYFSFTCMDSQMYNDDSDDNNRILGLSRTVFIAIIVVVGVIVLAFIGGTIWYVTKRAKNQPRPLTIQSGTGVMRRMITKSALSSKGEESAAVVVTAGDSQKREDSNSEMNKQVSSELVAMVSTSGQAFPKETSGKENTTGDDQENKPLTQNEIEAVERGGIHLKGYREAIVDMDDDEESLSSVDSKKVRFQDHAVFKQAAQETDSWKNPDPQQWLINPITGQMELKKPIQQQLGMQTQNEDTNEDATAQE